MSAWWPCLLLLASPTGEPAPPAEPVRSVRTATEQEQRESVDVAQLALGDWVAARRELHRELESLRKRGRNPGATRKLEQWLATDVDAEVRHIQAGLNAARHPH